MTAKLLNWLDNRTGYRSLMNEALYERIPGGARWRYVWGSTLVFTFVLQMMSGLFLWTAYSPSAQTAWESVYYIQNEMAFGSVVRGIHHYAAQLMIVLLAIHLIQVIIDGAYKAPREVNFWLGLILMQIVLGLSLTGYLLPWDQKGYYATQVSTKIMGATPLVGPQLQELAQGGPEYGHHTLTRFFAMHAGVLPASLVFFLALHIYVFRRHGLTVKDQNHAPTTTFWPDQVLKDAVACLGVLAVVMFLAVFKSAELSAPADPSEAYDAARPEWYFLFLFRFLRFHAVEQFGLAFGAIYIPGALMLVLVLMPIIAYWKGGHKFNVAFMWLITVGIIGLTALAFYEDGNDADHQAAIAEAERDAKRIVELAQGPDRIPVDGAVNLLRKDPFTQGPRLFAKHCASCHRYDGHNGRGRVLAEVDEQGNRNALPATAADLGNFGSRDWMRSVLVDYPKHFAALKNAKWFKEAKQKEEAGEEVEYIDPDNSEMADWSGDRDSLTSSENAENLNSLIEYMVSEAGHVGVATDDVRRERGKDIAMNGTWAGSIAETSCVDCHATMGQEFETRTADDTGGYPDIARYGSARWLTDFIRNPGSEQHYGGKNRMPAYADKLTAEELELLVRWMTGDYYPTEVADYGFPTETPASTNKAPEAKTSGE
jgi:ubiquinol-cytochrome c reductase cytochrome b subunit